MKRKGNSVRQDGIRLNRGSEFIAAFVDREATANFGGAGEGIGCIEPEAQLRGRELMVAGLDPISLSGWTSSSSAVV